MATAAPTTQTCRNFVNGQWVDSRSSNTIERRNPANLSEIVAIVPLSTREEMREAIAAAKAAFPMWRDTPAPVRGRIVAKAAALMTEQKDPDARRRQNIQGIARRSATRNQYHGVHRRRGTPAGGANLAQRTAKDICVYDQTASRSRWSHYAVELPRRHSGMESGACDCDRKYDGA